MRLGNDLITLRALEPEDVELLYLWENDPNVWGVSNTIAPFSKHVLRQFIEDQSRDIFQTGQMRFIIEACDNGRAVGTIDLFDFDPQNRRAGVGILVYDKDDRSKGYATAAVDALKAYCFGILRLHQLYSNVPADNAPSIALFEKNDFKVIAEKPQWLNTPKGWVDELMMSIIK